MDDLDAVTRLPEDFDGRVRLFPLPDLVLFPHAMQPLHIFEPRYCEMLTEALAGDHLVAMSTLTGADSAGVLADPTIASTVCLGRIISHAEVEEGRHNILLVGVRRARVVTELDAGRAFRMASVDVLDDIYPPVGATQRGQLKSELLEAFGEVIPASVNAQQNLHDLMAGQMGLGPITDIISYTLPFTVEEKLRLLGDANVDSRATELVGLLRSGSVDLQSGSTVELAETTRDNQQFPPPFSLN
jgi:ATP-dependent Lon protease